MRTYCMNGFEWSKTKKADMLTARTRVDWYSVLSSLDMIIDRYPNKKNNKKILFLIYFLACCACLERTQRKAGDRSRLIASSVT